MRYNELNFCEVVLKPCFRDTKVNCSGNHFAPDLNEYQRNLHETVDVKNAKPVAFYQAPRESERLTYEYFVY